MTPKQALRDDPDAFLRAGARPAFRCTTTGTTAHATAVWFSADEMHLFGALAAIGAFQNGTVRAEDQVLIAVSARNLLGVSALSAAAAAVGATVQLNGVLHPGHTLAALAERRPVAGHRPQISVMSLTPSYLGQLVEHAVDAGHRPADFWLQPSPRSPPSASQSTWAAEPIGDRRLCASGRTTGGHVVRRLR